MKTVRSALASVIALLCTSQITLAVERFVSPFGTHQPPFTSWADAATNIQDAIDVAVAGDVVWVTNGVYTTGGKAMVSNLTNRIAVDKAMLVRSVNGPEVTIIEGKWDATTTGPTAVRCAWLTNGASLNGFTLQGGATRGGGGALGDGGGVWCASSNSIIENCIIRSNAASGLGAAMFQGILRNSIITENKSANTMNAVVHNAVLYNCTVVSNLSVGVSQGKLTNSIVYFNKPDVVPPFGSNHVGSTFSYSCTTPLPPGPGNISSDPQFLSDRFHFASTSPCRSTGTNAATATDINGKPWGIPASMGAVESPSVPFVGTPQFQFANSAGFNVVAGFAGESPLTFRWFHNGLLIENDGHYSSADTATLSVNKLRLLDAGSYQGIVSNSFGSVTSAVAELVIRCVDAAGTGSVTPYTNWATAATNIQDAIDAAAPGDVVLVTNGVYATGGKAMYGNFSGSLTNRVTLDKPLAVVSVNGPKETIIQGQLDAMTNGLTAMRCAWLTNGAILNGFTLRGGATRYDNNQLGDLGKGGGVWGASTNALVINCVIATNYAHYMAGGAYRVSMRDCVLVGNTAGRISFNGLIEGLGGGAAFGNLRNCFITRNTAGMNGGGTFDCTVANGVLTENTAYQSGAASFRGWLVNSTVTGNTSGGQGGAVANLHFTNSIIVSNIGISTFTPTNNYNYYNSTSVYSCSFPLAPGLGNIAVDPQILPDGIHLSPTSPCRAAGTNSLITSTDIDGQPWVNPPSMGSDEWYPEPVFGGQGEIQISGVPPSLMIIGGKAIAGESPFAFSWLRDDVTLGIDPRYSPSELNLLVSNFGPEDAGNYQLVASNAFGIATSAVVRVAIHCVDAASSLPVPSYSDWSTAAANIQDAIDVAEAGAIILVTNGLYSSGGKVLAGDLTNRIAITKPVTVISVNGPSTTIIQGAWDANTNGPTAVRCAWMTNGATLSGFTLQYGATRTSGGGALENGGGVWGASTQALVVNCFISTNAANLEGGGVFQASVHRGKIRGNSAQSGGGTAHGLVQSSLIVGNSASTRGGGVYGSELTHCTIMANFAPVGGGLSALYPPTRNSIISGNMMSPSMPVPSDYVGVSHSISYSHLDSHPSGTPFPGPGNINANPQFTDEYHLAVTSPLRGAGNPLYASGTDLDGEPWLNPPSIGCDEVIEENLVGPLLLEARAQWSEVVERQSMFLIGTVNGRVSRLEWSFGDGSVLTNVSNPTPWHIWTNAGNYTATFTAYNLDHPDGVSTDVQIHVVPLIAPTFLSMGLNGTNFTLNFLGQSNVYGFVDFATNLTHPVTWHIVGGIFSNSDLIQVIDPKATNSARFYRVRIP